MSDDAAIIPNELLLMRLQRVTTGANVHRVANILQSYMGLIELYNRDHMRTGTPDPHRLEAVLAAERVIEDYIRDRS